MAKKKDITRNPPSWLEKGLFITVILIIIAIAFPIFWRLNESTRQFYECVNLQNELQQCINDWKEETGAEKFARIPLAELKARYGKEFPKCPYDSSIELVKIELDQYKQEVCTVSCKRHTYDSQYDTVPTTDPNSK